MTDQKTQSVAEREAELKAELRALELRKHPLRLLEALDAGALPQGTRLVVPGEDEGKVLALAPDEARTLLAPLRAILAARLAALGD